MPVGPAIAYIDRSAIVHNCELIRQMIPAGTAMCVAVKADAYGHGVGIVLPLLRQVGVEMVAVATVNEAVEVRQLGWDRSVLLLGSEVSCYDQGLKHDVIRQMVEYQVDITVTRIEELRELARAAQLAAVTARVQIEFDSGMSRMGVHDAQALELIAEAVRSPTVTLSGVYSHFAAADERDKSFTFKQLSAVRSLVDHVRTLGFNVPLLHVANSAATIDLPLCHMNMVRPGISVYGYHSSFDMHKRPDLRPAMRVASRISLVKTLDEGALVGYGCTYRCDRRTVAGIVPIGYADGYDRRLSNRAVMTVGGHTCPVIGRVSMDQTIIDLTDVVHAGVDVLAGQEVTVISEDPDDGNCVDTLVRLLDTIPNEIVTRLGPRIARVGVDCMPA